MNDIILKLDAFIDGIINKKLRINTKKISADLPCDFTFTYHAGALYTKPNTIKSIETAVRRGAEIIEFDVSFRKNGTPVIIHSESPKDNEGVLLKDALNAVTKSINCRINLDIKSIKNLSEIDKLVKEYGLFERVFFTGVFEDWIKTVNTQSAIPYFLNHNFTKDEAKDEAILQLLANKIISMGAIGINSNLDNASRLATEIMHKNGLLVSLWTANSAANIEKSLLCLPDNITTKRPHIAEKMI